MPRRYRLAAIDIGTNSIHMKIVEPLRRGYRVIDKEKEMVQLGKGSLEGNPLTEAAMERGVAVLKRMGDIARQWKVDDVIAVATSAVREAPNGTAFVRRAEEASGIHIRIISGEEEAEYIYRAIRNSVDFGGGTALCIDIGGGSVELIVATDEQVFFTRSEPLGALRLTEKFFKSDPPSDKSIYECRKYVRDRLKKPLARIRSLGFDFCIGTSGTIVTLAALSAPQAAGEANVALRTLSKENLERLIVELASRTAAARVEAFGLEPKRAETILAGAVAVDEILAAVRCRELRATSAALREGIIERYLGQRSGEVPLPGTVRREAVLELAERSDVDRVHAAHVAKLALRIFDQTRPLHGLKKGDREILEYAALAHEVGLSVSFDKYHRHTYYLVRHAGLRGFTEDQLAILANVARYHRKGAPKEDHQNFVELRPPQRAQVEKLSAILRIADALDRGRRQPVRDVAVEVDKFSATFKLRPRDDVAVEMEAAEKRAKSFARLFDRQTDFVIQE